MTNPLVSVVIPSYNSAHMIAETLDSVFAQSYPRLEVIVVNDGSKDATDEAVEPYRDRIIYINQQNTGLAGARNTGMARSSGELIAWLDADDLWNPDKVALQVAVMQQRPDNILVTSDFSAFDAEGYFEASHIRSYYSVIGRVEGGLNGIFPERGELDTRTVAHLPAGVPATIPIYGGELYQRLVDGNCVHPPAVMMRREATVRAGLLDKKFRRDVDYEFLLRVSRFGRSVFIDRPLMRYRYSANQMSGDQHLVDIALSRLLVLDELVARDPALLDKPGFRRRLGYSNLAAAHALADQKPAPALRHLLRSLRWKHVDGQTLRTVAKLILPNWAVERYRSHRS